MKHVLTKSVSVLAVCLLAAFVGAGCGGNQDQNKPEKTVNKAPADKNGKDKEKPNTGKEPDGPGGKEPDGPGGKEPDGPGDTNPVVPTCETDDACTENEQFCAPDPADTSRKICREVLKNSGAECGEDAECEDGSCFKLGPFYARGGYCSKTGCETGADCASYGTTGGLDSACVHPVQGDNFCASTCVRDDDCRGDYFCSKRATEQRGVCLPTSETLLAPQFEGEQCKRVSSEIPETFTFRVPEGALGYHIGGRALDGGELLPVIMQAGGEDYYLGIYDKYNRVIRGRDWQIGYGSFALESVISILAPLSPKFESMVTPGKEIKLQVLLKKNGRKSRYSDVCLKMTPKTKEGKTLDINVYLVGLPDEISVEVENAETNPALSEVFKQVRFVYEKAGFKIGKIRFIDVPEPIKKRFEVIRGEGPGPKAADLVSFSQDPAAYGENSNSINVFFVKAIDPSVILGISNGLPGLPGIHGMKGTGVVFSSVYLGKKVKEGQKVIYENGSRYTGNTMAHEMGHFLGLFHTSESSVPLWDPIQDTEECPWEEMNDPYTRGAFCPDQSNLMFPTAGLGNTEITDDQAYVISRNPLFH